MSKDYIQITKDALLGALSNIEQYEARKTKASSKRIRENLSTIKAYVTDTRKMLISADKLGYK